MKDPNKIVSDHRRLLTILQEAAGERLAASYVSVFLAIAESGGAVSNGTLERTLGMSAGATSRAVQALSALSWRKDERGFKVPGAGWLEEERDPRDARNKAWRLSAEGERVYAKLKATQ